MSVQFCRFPLTVIFLWFAWDQEETSMGSESSSSFSSWGVDMAAQDSRARKDPPLLPAIQQLTLEYLSCKPPLDTHATQGQPCQPVAGSTHRRLLHQLDAQNPPTSASLGSSPGAVSEGHGEGRGRGLSLFAQLPDRLASLRQVLWQQVVSAWLDSDPLCFLLKLPKLQVSGQDTSLVSVCGLQFLGLYWLGPFSWKLGERVIHKYVDLCGPWELEANVDFLSLIS